ncbi:MAG: hypothetical protein AAEJ47_09475 [Planctomycetota bacterium]
MRFFVFISALIVLAGTLHAQVPVPPLPPTGPPILLELGNIQYNPSTGEGSVSMMMTSTVPIAGFQFDLVFEPAAVLLVAATGGLAEDFGYDVGVGPTSGTVLGFSFTLVEIPPTLVPDVLTVVAFNCSGCPNVGPEICIENVVFSDVGALSIPVDLGPCATAGAMALFLRGDCNTDGATNVADAIFLLANLFSGGDLSSCIDGCDSNDDGSLNIADAIHFLAFLFSGGPPPTAPGVLNCGPDPTADPLDCLTPGLCP